MFYSVWNPLPFTEIYDGYFRHSRGDTFLTSAALLLYTLVGAVHRLCFSPRSKSLAPKLPSLTLWYFFNHSLRRTRVTHSSSLSQRYECYYDVVLHRQYTSIFAIYSPRVSLSFVSIHSNCSFQIPNITKPCTPPVQGGRNVTGGNRTQSSSFYLDRCFRPPGMITIDV